MLVNTGHTVHVVPTENGGWTVVDLQRQGRFFPSKTAALERAKSIALANQPSQVVLFSATGATETIAHYQLPLYQIPQSPSAGDDASLFDTAVKALVIGGMAAAGVAVLHDLVENVQSDLKRESTRSKPGQRRRRRLQEA
jgi:hypothetical protein